MSLLAALLLAASPSFPGVHPAGEEIIGFVRSHVVLEDESLFEIARDHDVGVNAITEANPDLDPFVPGTGALATVPTAWILPEAASPGSVVVNLSELRLYYFSPVDRAGTRWVVTFPLGIGSEGKETPLGNFSVIARRTNPSWHVPPSIRREDPDLPDEVPAGPDNPLGTHALRLSAPGVLIHGTNKPWGVGQKASHGCLRLYPEDIPWLYRLVRVGTPVRVIREPVKVGQHDGHVYVEVHADELVQTDLLAATNRLLGERGLLETTDPEKVAQAVEAKRGFPVDVTR